MTIQDTINKYRQHFDTEGGLAEELYKWKIITNLHGRPDIDASDFVEEIYSLKLGNLLYGPQQSAICNLAKHQTDGYRNALRSLFDETVDLQSRVTAFIKECNSLWNEIKDKFDKNTSSLADERLIAALLTCKFPDKYTFYKNDIYGFMCQLTGAKKKSAGQKLVHYYEILKSDIMPELEKANDLIAAVDAELDAKGLIHSMPLTAQTVMWYVMSTEKCHNPAKTRDDLQPRLWLYAPGENATYWQQCVDGGIMAIGWHEMGDLSKYTSLDNVKECAKEIYDNLNSWSQSGLAMWQFVNDIRIGDIIIAKDGRRKLVGMGTVTGEYQYNPDAGDYPNERTVKWEKVGTWQWSRERELPLKTLTRIDDTDAEKEFIAQLLAIFDEKQEKTEAERNDTQKDGVKYWWLVGKPKIFKFSDIPLGGTQEWTMYTDNGTKRRVFQNFLDAKKGDIVFCYQATPMLQLVALGEISREQDGQTIEIRKTETLLKPIDYAEIKAYEALADMEFLVNPNGSFFKVSPDEASELMELIRADNPIVAKEDVKKYDVSDFLNEVYMDESEYRRLTQLLRTKKNIILQGAPGVGKTFTAKRLAYSLLGEKDDMRVEMVQFHQNYSYEDFIMGYKPDDNGGFTLIKGVFHSFCERARNDREHDYFFIIDEINRGNLSKIFGELLMLVEKGYRDTEIRISNRGETFMVPSNLYIIGMMNTADRSLALIDYALRRRFSFFEIKPAFDSKGFTELQKQIGSEKFKRVVETVKQLNETIMKDESLGTGFCIGHSYFCSPEDDIDLWLENVVDYDIEPMLREYWFDNTQKYTQEINKIRSALK